MGVVMVDVLVTGTGVVVPACMFTVESSRSAVVLPGGRVPDQASEGSTTRVRWSLCNTEEGGMIIGPSSDEDRGRKDESMVNESRIAWALDVSETGMS